MNIHFYPFAQEPYKLELFSLQRCKRLDAASAAVLAMQPMLRVVELTGTAMTEKGLAILRRAKPHLQLVHF